MLEPSGRHLHLLRATGQPRNDIIDGRTHLIVPCVALMEAVIHAVNSDIPEMVPLDTLKAAAKSWDGKPVLLGHPIQDGRQIPAATAGVFAKHGLGTIRNPRVSGTKLLMDACLDPKLVEKVGGLAFLKSIQDGTDHIEVSVGAYVHAEDGEGEFGGKQYKATWRGTTGDHLALLPGKRGACSVEAGCGTHRAAQRFVAAEEFRMATDEEMATLAQASGMMECPTCDGEGTFKGNPCPTCDGEGEIPMSENPRMNRDISQKMRDEMSGSDFAGKGDSFPIKVPGDVQAAARSIGRAGADNYSTDQLKANIIKIARRKGPSFVAQLPEAWQKDLKAAEELVGLLGKRNSAKDVEIIQNVHDHAVSLGARCDMQNMKMAEAKPVYLSASLIEDSLNERMDDVREAVQAAYPANVGQMAASMPAPSYTYVVAVYDDHVIINTDGTLYSVDYTVGKDGEVVLSDKQTEVKQAYVAASAVEDKPTTIVLEGGKWTIKSKDQLRRLGSHDTKQEAEEHEQAIARSLARLRAEPPTCSCQKH